jgi:ParB-like chromosome segregation protein Spo0J
MYSQAMAQQFADFGFLNPLLVDSNAVIISGYGRVLAARKLQLETVPVVVLDHPSEAQKPVDVLAAHRGVSK